MLIVQITDMHVSKPGKLFGKRIDTRAAFERCVSHVLTLRPLPDLVLLTGDLAETGDPEEYDFIAKHIERFKCPVLAIPGNHDLREEMLRTIPKTVTQQAGGHLSFADNRFPVRVIGLDTIVPGKVHGDICERRLAWLQKALSEESSKPILIAMHHPPFTTRIAAMDNYGIKRGLEEFRKIVAEYAQNVSVIACGHVHRTVVGNISGVPVLIAPASSLAFDLDLGERPSLNFVEEPPQFLIHSWTGSAGLVSHVVFVDNFPGPIPVL